MAASSLQPHLVQKADISFNLDLIQIGLEYAVSITAKDNTGLSLNLLLKAEIAAQLGKAITVAAEQAKSKIVLPS
jgi:hypothetical protein